MEFVPQSPPQGRHPFTCCIVGAGILAVRCAEAVLAREHRIVGVHTTCPTLLEWARTRKINHAEPDKSLADFLAPLDCDLLFAIQPDQALSEVELSIPTQRSISFHDSLLPRHAGSYAVSWALMQRDAIHGVTWCEATTGTDAGDIFCQQPISISSDETASSLLEKCLEMGISSFESLIDEISNRGLHAVPQQLEKRTYHPRDEGPARAGLICWHDHAEVIASMIRGLDFGSHDNPLGLAKLMLGNAPVVVQGVDIIRSISTSAPGTIESFDSDRLTVAAVGGQLALSRFSTLSGVAIAMADLVRNFKLLVGQVLQNSAPLVVERGLVLQVATMGQEDHWVSVLEGGTPISIPGQLRRAAPFSYPRAGMRRSLMFQVPDGVASTLATRFPETSFSNTLHAAFVILLSRIGDATRLDLEFSDQFLRDLVSGVESLYVNHIPLSYDVSPDLTFGEMVRQVVEQRQYARQHGTFARDMRARRRNLRHARGAVEPSCPEVAVQEVHALRTEDFCGEASLVLSLPTSGPIFFLNSDVEVFDDPKAGWMAARLLALLQAIADAPEQAIGNLSLLSSEERSTILKSWNDTHVTVPKELDFVALVMAQVERNPDAVAITFFEESLTYAQLDKRAGAIASYLQTIGVRPGEMIAIAVERTPMMIAALLGILKSGAGYVPLDPSFPQDRLRFMFQDSGARILLTEERLVPAIDVDASQIVRIDSDWPAIERSIRVDVASNEVAVLQGSRAYVLYTSGSTGMPKGVEISRRGFTNFLCSMQRVPGLTERDRVLALTTLSFDIAGLEIFLPLITGACIQLGSRQTASDPQALLDHISRTKPTLVQATPTTWRLLLDAGWKGDRGITAICGGEELTRELADRLAGRVGTLWNLYGPTETAVWSTAHRYDSSDEEITVGRPIANTEIYVLDTRLNPMPPGIPGEIHIGGMGVGPGYRNRPDLTAQSYLPNPFSSDPDARIYRTGDLGRFRDNGDLVHLGRLDFQVKIRGFRIEIGEVEAVLQSYPLIGKVVVGAHDTPQGDKCLVAYYGANLIGEVSSDEIREFLRNKLPDYMIPQHFVEMRAFPVTPNGKVDRKKLPNPGTVRPGLPTPYHPAGSELQKAILGIWEATLGISLIGIDDNFFDLGGSSLQVVHMLGEIEKTLGKRISVGRAFARPTVRELESLLTNVAPLLDHASQSKPEATEDIAIVGMAGRFPGAPDVLQFWRNLCEGRETISFFQDAEIHPSIPAVKLAGANYVKARGVISDADCFDAGFFGINPIEANVIDPQQRLLLETAWHTLEDAGIECDRIAARRVGVFAGVGDTEYFHRNLIGNPAVSEYGDFRLRLANEKDFSATRIAFALALEGPAINVQTACSTSLVAVTRGMQSLKEGECEVALCGGAYLPIPQYSGHEYNEGSAFSRDGHCRPYDADATGTVFSSGVGMVALMRLTDARKEGCRIYAVLRGAGVNNDGGGKMSFMAPSVEGQAKVLAQALSNSGIKASDVTYIEGHGTATPLGDPIEVEALAAVYGDSSRPVYLGSVKGNIGHTDAAAGMAGLIKTALALHHRLIPPSINFQTPNPRIPLNKYGLEVNTVLRPWPSDRPQCAAVSSLGVGGTNVHVILTAAEGAVQDIPAGNCSLLLFSGKSASAAGELGDAVISQIRIGGHVESAASTLCFHRRHFEHRQFRIVAGSGEYREQVRGTGHARSEPARVAFLFPGQGSQYLRMGEYLYLNRPVFRQTLDLCSEIALPGLGVDLRALLYPGDAATVDEATERLSETRYTQPALLAIGLALGRLWQSLGVRPAALLGHSIGEFAAACLSEVMSVEDAVNLVVKRGQLMWEVEPGSMLSVRMASIEIEALLTRTCSIAAINGPHSCVVAGPRDEIAELQERLTTADVSTVLLRTSHAFHSPMMDGIVSTFEAEVAQIRLSPPKVPILSTVTATWLDDDLATDPGYWAQQLRRPVRFADAIQALWSSDGYTALEMGPRATLSTLARGLARDRSLQVAFPAMGNGADSEESGLLAAAGHLWSTGIPVDLAALVPKTPPATLPGYPFARKRHWIEAPTAPTHSSADFERLHTMQQKILEFQAELLARTREVQSPVPTDTPII